MTDGGKFKNAVNMVKIINIQRFFQLSEIAPITWSSGPYILQAGNKKFNIHKQFGMFRLKYNTAMNHTQLFPKHRAKSGFHFFL